MVTLACAHIPTMEAAHGFSLFRSQDASATAVAPSSGNSYCYTCLRYLGCEALNCETAHTFSITDVSSTQICSSSDSGGGRNPDCTTACNNLCSLTTQSSSCCSTQQGYCAYSACSDQPCSSC